MSPKLLMTVSLIVLTGCADSEPVENSTVGINAAAIEAQSAVDAYGDNIAAEDGLDPATAIDNDAIEANNGASDLGAGGNAGALEPLDPPAPGTPGGLADDRTPISEAKFTPDSAQGAGNVVQTYFALLGERRFTDARVLWEPDAAGAGRDSAAFTAMFDRYSEYHANVGAPGRIEAGAGQRYVTVPVQVYARLKADRTPFYAIGSVTLHRAGEIDGASRDQRSWRLARISLKPVQKQGNSPTR